MSQYWQPMAVRNMDPCTNIFRISGGLGGGQSQQREMSPTGSQCQQDFYGTGSPVIEPFQDLCSD